MQAIDETQNLITFSSVVEVVRPEVMVEGPVFEHVVDGGEHGGGDGANGLVCAAPAPSRR